MRGRLTEWYTVGDGRRLVETSYAPDSIINPVVFTVPGANMSPMDRATLLLASLAGEEFRAGKGLVTAAQITLAGEDGHAAGWLRDSDLRAEMRDKVRERMKAGEINPTLIFGGSGNRVLLPGKDGKKGELDTVSGYLVPDVYTLFAEKGLTEADSMLAGALRVWDGDPESITVEDLAIGNGQSAAKLVRFQSSLGLEVAGIMTTGAEASVRGQLNRLFGHDPQIFAGKDGFIQGTTGIYAPAQYATALEFGIAAGFSTQDVYGLGHSAHAAGIPRVVGTLVGEQVKGLLAIESLAKRNVEISERHMEGHVGETSVHGAGVADPR